LDEKVCLLKESAHNARKLIQKFSNKSWKNITLTTCFSEPSMQPALFRATRFSQQKLPKSVEVLKH